MEATLAAQRDQGSIAFAEFPPYSVGVPRQAGHGDGSYNVAGLLNGEWSSAGKRQAVGSTSTVSPPPSVTAKAWELPGIGGLSVTLVDTPHLTTIDSEWPPLRPSTDLTNAWVWSDIVAQNRESFVVLRSYPKGDPVAIWSSKARSLLRLPVGRCYRLDHIEIDPRLRGGVLGYFTLGVIASRALELGAEAMVLQTFQTHVKIYTDFGGQAGPVRGWNHDPKLVPFFFGSATLQEMRDDADVFLKS